MPVRGWCAMLCTFVLAVGAGFSEQVTSPEVTNRVAATTQSLAEAQPGHEKAADSESSIAGGDLLRVRVFGVNDFDQEVRVSALGNISLPLIGDVKVSGLTTERAQLVIAQKLIDGNFMLHPQVLIFEKEYATQAVAVMGEVTKPGMYPLFGRHSIFDVLSMAGGVTEKSGPMVTISHRDHSQHPVEVKLSDIGKSSDANREVLPGDTVLVSRAGIVYVVGDVRNPSGVVILSGSEMTVLKAIAMAGGINQTAAVNRTKLIRRTANGPVETPIPLKRILAAKASDLKLEADDIIFVPSSAAKGASKRGIEAVLQAAATVAIYRVP